MESLVVLPSLSHVELISRIKETLTSGGLGLVLGTACVLPQLRNRVTPLLTCFCFIPSLYSVYGIAVFQTYIYFRNNGQDSVYVKSFVSKRNNVQ